MPTKRSIKSRRQQRSLPLEIRKSNELVRAEIQIRTSPVANKLFACLVAGIDPGHFPDVVINAKDIIQGYDPGGTDYATIENACDILSKAGIKKVFYNAGSKPNFEFSAIFKLIRYEDGVITAIFQSQLEPHLLALKKRFTSLNLFELMAMPSFYSQRIYEIAKSYEKPNGFGEILIDDFYDMIAFPKDMRNNFNNLKRKALEQTEKDIEGNVDLFFKWRARKQGRKVVAIEIFIGDEGFKLWGRGEKKKLYEESRARRPMLASARKCRLAKGIQGGNICLDLNKRYQKCKSCMLHSDVKGPEKPSSTIEISPKETKEKNKKMRNNPTIISGFTSLFD